MENHAARIVHCPAMELKQWIGWVTVKFNVEKFCGLRRRRQLAFSLDYIHLWMPYGTCCHCCWRLLAHRKVSIIICDVQKWIKGPLALTQFVLLAGWLAGTPSPSAPHIPIAAFSSSRPTRTHPRVHLYLAIPAHYLHIVSCYRNIIAICGSII